MTSPIVIKQCQPENYWVWDKEFFCLTVCKQISSLYQYSILSPGRSGHNRHFLRFFCLSIPRRDLETRKTTPNMEVCPESLGAMLDHCYIERSQFVKGSNTPCILLMLAEASFGRVTPHGNATGKYLHYCSKWPIKCPHHPIDWRI